MTVYASPTSIRARALELLAALGDTADTVAATLDQLGCRGERGKCSVCPVAVYLLRSDLHPHEASLDVGLATLRMRIGDGSRVYDIPVPAPVRAFIERFDQGKYDGLVVTDAEGGDR